MERNFYKAQFHGVNFILQNRYTSTENIGLLNNGYLISAHDTVENREVTIKKLTRPFNNSLTAKHTYRELFILKSNNHPNIINLLNIYTPQEDLSQFNDLYIVTEFYENSMLNLMCKKMEKLGHTHISFLLYQALCGLNYLNQMGIIHGNLTPENIIVKNDCTLKIVNFGSPIEYHYKEMLSDTKIKPYKSPELIFGMSYSFNVDIWSLALIFIELFMSYSQNTPMFNLFSGIDHNEQWLKIIQILGTHSKKFIERTKSCKNWIEKFPKFEAKSWDEILPDNCFLNTECSSYFSDSMAREILSEMLKIDPEERYTVEKTLQDSYVNCWFRDEEVNLKPIRKYDDTIEKSRNLNENDWKGLIFGQVKDFEEKNNKEFGGNR